VLARNSGLERGVERVFGEASDADLSLRQPQRRQRTRRRRCRRKVALYVGFPETLPQDKSRFRLIGRCPLATSNGRGTMDHGTMAVQRRIGESAMNQCTAHGPCPLVVSGRTPKLFSKTLYYVHSILHVTLGSMLESYTSKETQKGNVKENFEPSSHDKRPAQNTSTGKPTRHTLARGRPNSATLYVQRKTGQDVRARRSRPSSWPH
jgi:hypothetical protein